MKKLILILGLIFGTLAYGSWWGHRSRATRAGLLLGSAVVLNEIFHNNCRRDEFNSNRNSKCYNHGNYNEYSDNYCESGNEYLDRYVELYGNDECARKENSKLSKGKIIFSDEKTQIIELSNGERVIIKK